MKQWLGMAEETKVPPLQFEETPIIEPIPETEPSEVPKEAPAEPIGPEREIASPPPEAALSPPKPSPVPQNAAVKPKKKSFVGTSVHILFFVLLFAAGIGVSIVLRDYISTSSKEKENSTALLAPTGTPASEPTVSTDPFFKWKTYSVISGMTKQAIEGLTIKLPPDLISPICDGPTCSSQGTYLPGGTRFTVAPRGKGQLLPTTQGAIMTDAGGRTFVMKDASISGYPAQEFTGLFAGTTGGGYTFSQIRGIVIHGPAGISLEVNHFTPTGVDADWNADDRLFDTIVGLVSFGDLPLPTPTIPVIITPEGTQSSTMTTATSSTPKQ